MVRFEVFIKSNFQSAVIALYRFTANNEYRENSPKEISGSIEAEYIKTINKNEPNADIQKNYVKFFDEVNYVEAMFSEDVGYYFVVHRKIHGDYTFHFQKLKKLILTTKPIPILILKVLRQPNLPHIATRVALVVRLVRIRDVALIVTYFVVLGRQLVTNFKYK